MKSLSELFKITAWDADYKEAGDDVNYAFEEEGSTLYIYFQGSSSVTDWFRNFLFPAKPYKDMGIPYRVHRGFLQAWKEVEDIIISKINEDDDEGKFKFNHIVVVGYSHGGSLTFFTTECIWYWRPDLRNGGFEAYAFESPRVLAGFRAPKKIKDRWNNMIVIRVGSDLVTHCPPAIFGFCHTGKILHLKGDASIITKRMPKCIKYHYPEVVYNALLKYEENN